MRPRDFGTRHFLARHLFATSFRFRLTCACVSCPPAYWLLRTPYSPPIHAPLRPPQLKTSNLKFKIPNPPFPSAPLRASLDPHLVPTATCRTAFNRKRGCGLRRYMVAFAGVVRAQGIIPLRAAESSKAAFSCRPTHVGELSQVLAVLHGCRPPPGAGSSRRQRSRRAIPVLPWHLNQLGRAPTRATVAELCHPLIRRRIRRLAKKTRRATCIAC